MILFINKSGAFEVLEEPPYKAMVLIGIHKTKDVFVYIDKEADHRAGLTAYEGLTDIMVDRWCGGARKLTANQGDKK